MAEDGRVLRDAPFVVQHRKIRVAKAAVLDRDLHVFGPERTEVDLLANQLASAAVATQASIDDMLKLRRTAWRPLRIDQTSGPTPQVERVHTPNVGPCNHSREDQAGEGRNNMQNAKSVVAVDQRQNWRKRSESRRLMTRRKRNLLTFWGLLNGRSSLAHDARL